MTTAEILKKIEEELARAKSIHPHFPDNVVEAVAVMAEEAGEAARAANDCRWKKHKTDNLIEELIQTAAMCVRVIEKFNRGIKTIKCEVCGRAVDMYEDDWAACDRCGKPVCKRCDSRTGDDEFFCEECRKESEVKHGITCPYCGHRCHPDSEKCPRCFRSLHEKLAEKPVKWHNPKNELPNKTSILHVKRKTGSVNVASNLNCLEDWSSILDWSTIDGYLYFSDVCTVLKKLEVEQEGEVKG